MVLVHARLLSCDRGAHMCGKIFCVAVNQDIRIYLYININLQRLLLPCSVGALFRCLAFSLTAPFSAGVPTEESQMVQDLLEMVSDAPVDHAGQWIPVRVRRGIHIWTSTVEGSPYCRIRGRMRCEATPAQLLQLLIDDERYCYMYVFNARTQLT